MTIPDPNLPQSVDINTFLNQIMDTMGQDYIEQQLGPGFKPTRSGLTRDQIITQTRNETIQFYQSLAQAGKLDFPPGQPLLAPPAAGGAPPPGGHGNVWLDNPNMGAAVTYYFMAAMSMLKYSRVVELQFKLAAMEWIGLLAKESAEMVLRSSELEAKRLELQAMSAIIQGTVSLAVAGVTMFGIAKAQTGSSILTNVTAGTPNMFQMGVNHLVEGASKFMEAAITLEKGKVDAYKEIISGCQRIAEQMMQSAFQADQELEELLKKILDLLRTIWEQQYQTMGKIFA